MKYITDKISDLVAFEQWYDTKKNKKLHCRIHDLIQPVNYNFTTILDYNSIQDNTLGIHNIKGFKKYATRGNINKQNILIITGPWFDNYGHVLHDILPILLYLDTCSTVDMIVCRSTHMLDSLVKLHGIQFSKIKFLKYEEKLPVVNCNISVFKFYHPICRYTEISTAYKQKLDRNIDKNNVKINNNKLLYCSRNSSTDVKHARRMDQACENQIINKLQQFAKEKKLDFTIFTGQQNNKTMSHYDQLMLFRQAKIVVGPHGSAMANVIYLDPINQPIVCEFTSGSENVVHSTEPFKKNYNNLNNFIFDELYQYFLIPFDNKSTNTVTSIDLKFIERFLNEI